MRQVGGCINKSVSHLKAGTLRGTLEVNGFWVQNPRCEAGGQNPSAMVEGATGFDGVSEAVAACPGPRVPGKTLGKFLTANNNLALAA